MQEKKCSEPEKKYISECEGSSGGSRNARTGRGNEGAMLADEGTAWYTTELSLRT